MARKTKEETEQTRKNIINAALELFHETGYSRTTLEQIARKAGVTRGAIYWHFKDKVDLFLELKEEMELSAGMRMEDLLLWPVDSLDDLQEGIMRWVCRIEEDERFGRYVEMVLYRAEFTEELNPVLEQYRDKCGRIQQKDEEDLLRLQQAGKVRVGVDCNQAALGIRFLVMGAIHTWLLDSEAFSLTEQGGALIGDFLNSLQTTGTLG